MHLLLDTRGVVIKHRNGCFHVRSAAHERLISPKKITSIAILSEATINTAAIHLAIKNRIPIYFFGQNGEVSGRIWSASFNRFTIIRRNQVLFPYDKQATQWALDLFTLKLEQQLHTLNYILDRKRALSSEFNTLKEFYQKQMIGLKALSNDLLADCREKMMGIEGAAAKLYWQVLAAALQEPYTFKGRSRPATDPFNCALNYMYGMLYSVVETALFSAGLDPYLGIIHSDQYQKPTLSFDLIEPFRPWIDRLLLDLVWQEKIQLSFFQMAPDRVTLTKEGKRFIIPAFLNFMDEKGKLDHQIHTRHTLVYRKAGDLARFLLDFKPANYAIPGNI